MAGASCLTSKPEQKCGGTTPASIRRSDDGFRLKEQTVDARDEDKLLLSVARGDVVALRELTERSRAALQLGIGWLHDATCRRAGHRSVTLHLATRLDVRSEPRRVELVDIRHRAHVAVRPGSLEGKGPRSRWRSPCRERQSRGIRPAWPAGRSPRRFGRASRTNNSARACVRPAIHALRDRKTLDIPLGTVKTRLYAGLKKLRSELVSLGVLGARRSHEAVRRGGLELPSLLSGELGTQDRDQREPSISGLRAPVTRDSGGATRHRLRAPSLPLQYTPTPISRTACSSSLLSGGDRPLVSAAPLRRSRRSTSKRDLSCARRPRLDRAARRSGWVQVAMVLAPRLAAAAIVLGFLATEWRSRFTELQSTFGEMGRPLATRS